jgi:hypothetical protein
MDGMVNTGELSINVVKSDKPKMLRGLSQTALWIGSGCPPYLDADALSTGA